MTNTIKGTWRDKTATIIVNKSKIDTLSSFFLIDTNHYTFKDSDLLEYQTEEGVKYGGRRQSIVDSEVTLYRCPESDEICMFRWPNGIDVPLGVSDLQDAKNAAEAMLQLEGVSYAK